MLRFRGMGTLQKLASDNASVCNHSNRERGICSRETVKANRAAALAEWRQLGAA